MVSLFHSPQKLCSHTSVSGIASLVILFWNVKNLNKEISYILTMSGEDDWCKGKVGLVAGIPIY